MILSDLHTRWLANRSIDIEIAIRMGLWSGRREQGGQSIVPDIDGDVLCYPYIKDDQIVGTKFRGPNKTFWQAAGGRKQFWNRDILKDPSLLSGERALLIVEGENDALAVMSAGYPFVVSVPDGAPPPRDANGVLIKVPEGTADIDPNDDLKYSYLSVDWDLLSKVPRIVVGADADEAGQRLAQELVRRLDRVRCSFCTFPEGRKDWNEILIQDGSESVLDIIEGARPYPIDGVYGYDDLPPMPAIRTFSTGWNNLDDLIRPYLGGFMVVGGFPGHGKSTWTMQFVANVARIYKFKVAVASFEMQVVPYVTDALATGFLGRNVRNANDADRRRSRDFLREYFTFIAPNRSNNEAEHDIDWLLDRMTAAVIRNGVKVVLIDPFNEIEHRKKADESQTEYIGRAIRKMKSFAMTYDVLVCVVVHPTKAAAGMDSADLGLYNLADSSHWANKADIGVIIGRMGNPEVDTITGIYVKKIRYQPDAGKPGTATLDFSRDDRVFL